MPVLCVLLFATACTQLAPAKRADAGGRAGDASVESDAGPKTASHDAATGQGGKGGNSGSGGSGAPPRADAGARTDAGNGGQTQTDAGKGDADTGTTPPDSGTAAPDTGTASGEAGADSGKDASMDSGADSGSLVIPPSCGDGHIDSGEACDDRGESATCNADCTLASCGDHKLNATAGEACDDGGESARCNADCTTASCGDHKVNATAGESCDDGGESANCNADCTTASCGDHKVNATAGESCDDGKNGNNADGCTDSCAFSCTMDSDCGATYGGRCDTHACVPLAFGPASPLATGATLGYPSVAMDGRGNAIVVWGGDGSVHHAWYTPANGWGSASVVVSNGKYPHVASDGRGNLLLAYSATDPNTAKLEHVDMRRYRPASGASVPDPSGWGSEYTLQSYSNYNPTGTDWISPAVAMASNGDAWLAWRAQQQTSGGMGNSATWVASCPNGGDTCLTAKSIDSATRLMSHPQVAMDDSGFYPIVVWSMSVNTGENSLIRAARYDTSWTLSDAATATSPDIVTAQSLVADGSGQAWLPIARVSGGVLSGSVLRNRRPSLLGAFAWDSPQASPRDLALEVAANAAGDLLGACIEIKNGNTTEAITGAALSSGSSTWSAEAPLDSFPFNSSSETPRVAIDGFGHGVALWVTSDGAKSAVEAARVVRNANVTWSGPVDVSARTVNTLSNILVALEADGRGAAVWLEDDGNQVTVWASALR